jgi:hypothetical protein
MKKFCAGLGLVCIAFYFLVMAPVRVSAAVTITGFNAKAQNSQIVLGWQTLSETNNAGFNLYRSTSPFGPWTSKINSSLIPVCSGCSVMGGTYSQTDGSASAGKIYYYRLESVELSGGTQQFGPVSAQIAAAATATSVATPTRTGTVPPTATNTPTPIPGTATNTPVPGTATPTVYSSPTPFGTPPPTETPFPTRIAYVVGQPTLTPVLPANINRVPPKNNPGNPPVVNPSSAPQAPNDPPVVASVLDESPSAAEDTPSAADAPQRAIPGPIALGLIALAGILAVTGLSFGAVSFYFIARRFVR